MYVIIIINNTVCVDVITVLLFFLFKVYKRFQSNKVKCGVSYLHNRYYFIMIFHIFSIVSRKIHLCQNIIYKDFFINNIGSVGIGTETAVQIL